MKKLNKLLIMALCIVFHIAYTSCSDDNTFEHEERFSTTFRVYECNEDYTEQHSASSRYVSEDAVVTIWKLNDSHGYDFVTHLKTGLDGTVKYWHDDEIIFYTVEKEVLRDNEKIVKSNLVLLNLKDENKRFVSAAKFQIDGIITSQEDIEYSPTFNFGVDRDEYSPKVGALKFKDINGDGYIDIEDSISKSMVDVFWHDGEEIVYIASSK